MLCEKPVAATLAGLDAIAQAQKEGGGVFSGVFQLMFGRGARPVRLLLDEGKLGRLHLGIADTLWFRDRDYYEEVPWRGSWERECGGVTVSRAIHLIELLLWHRASWRVCTRKLECFARAQRRTTAAWRSRGQKRRDRPDHIDDERIR